MTKRQGTLHFIYAPPLKGKRKSRRKPPKPPYKGAERWKWSVFYYWWEYLRRHEGYRVTCQSKGRGKYAKLYKDFGDIHQGDFWSWWTAHAQIFAEPEARNVAVVDLKRIQSLDKTNKFFVEVPRENSIQFTVKRFRDLLERELRRPDKSNINSKALYKVATKPVLASLHMHLKVWDAKEANPTKELHELADIAGVGYNHEVNGETLISLRQQGLPSSDVERVLRRRKSLVVKRHLRLAGQYIKNVADAQTFPLRKGR